jgi:NADH:ubiquinone oxidoreductase subunit C
MNDLMELWTENNYLIFYFKNIFNNLYDFYLIKKKKFFFFINTFLYFFLFNILSSNIILKIKSIIDIVAIHYPDNIDNEFEFLYVNINYKLNLRFFFKLFIKKEDLMISISNLYKSTA